MKSQAMEPKNDWLIVRNILIIVIFFHFINNLFWIKNDGYLLAGSHAVWLEEKSLLFAQVLSSDKLPVHQKWLKTIGFLKLDYGGYAFRATNFNLTSLLLAFPIASALNGHGKLLLIKALLFSFFLFMLFALYYLGELIFNKTIGAWGAIILSFYPGIVGLSRKTNTVVLVTFFVLVSVIVFIRWAGLPRILRSLLLLAIFILGVLSGGLFLVFFIPLFLFHLFLRFFQDKRKIENLLESAIFLISVLFFFNFYSSGEFAKVSANLKSGLSDIFRNLFLSSYNFIGSGKDGIIGLFLFSRQDAFCVCTQIANVGMNIKTFLFYILETMYYMSPLFFLLAVPSFFGLLRDKRVNLYKRMYLGIWLVTGYLFLSLFQIKWGKFITPLLPVLALSSGKFIYDYSRKARRIKTIVICAGLLTTVYYSYFRITHKLFLETLNESIIAHRPMPSRVVSVAEQIAARIDADEISKKKDMINIAFLDTESMRHKVKGGNWITDMSVGTDNLIQIFLKKRYRAEYYWRTSGDFHNMLHKQDFIVLITQNKIKTAGDYLFSEIEDNGPGLKLEVALEDRLLDSVFIDLIKVRKE